MLLLALLASAEGAFPRPAGAEPARPAAARGKRVLLLLSSNCGMPWYEVSAQAIADTFQAAGRERPIALYIEFAGLDGNWNPAYLQSLYGLYRQKYAKVKLDLVMAVADLAVDFALQYRQELFPGVPMVVVAEPEVMAKLRGQSNLTGVIGTARIKDNLELVLSLHPDTRHIAVVSGGAAFDRFYETMARELFAPFQDRLEFIWLCGLPNDELLARLGRLPPSTVVFYLLTNQDGAGIDLIPRQELPRIARAAGVPVYGLWDTLLGYGMVGGLLSSAELAGIEAARLGLSILEGEKPESIPFVRGAYAHMFDWRELQKWDIPESALPPDSIIRYRELSFWDLYKWRILLTALLLAAAVAVLIQVRVRRYKNQIRRQDQIRRMLEKQVAERTAGLQKANQELARLSNLDGLTGLYNRRYFDATLDREWKRHLRDQAPLAVIMGDLDWFKAFNDTYGHPAGDDCLRRVARALRARIKRPSDLGARYGGEEFALVLSNTDAAGALKLAQDLAQAIRGLAIPHRASPAGPLVTMSFGVAAAVPTPNGRAVELVRLADQALYRAKDRGRDRVELAPGSPSPP